MREDSKIHLEIALRVLTAMTQCGREQADGDAVALRTLAETDEERIMPLDELACEVVKRERKRLNEMTRQAAV